MITGQVVNGFDPVLTITVLGDECAQLDLHAIVDTGFAGAITLTRRQIDKLCLMPSGGCAAVLADGQIVDRSVFRAIVRFDGELREVPAIEVPDGTLIGMELLQGFRITMDVVKDGEIFVERLSGHSDSAV